MARRQGLHRLSELFTSPAPNGCGALWRLDAYATPEAAQAALDDIKSVAESIRSVEGPEKFVTLRDSWTTSIDSFAAEGEKAIAGDITGLDAATAEMRAATDAMLAYCTP